MVLTEPACIADELVCVLQYWEVIILEHGYMRCTVNATSLSCEVGTACSLLVVVHHHVCCTAIATALFWEVPGCTGARRFWLWTCARPKPLQ